MKVIRTHFRRAMKDGVVSRDADPFFAYSPPKAKRVERHKLTEAELARLEGLDLGERWPGRSADRSRPRLLPLLALHGRRRGSPTWPGSGVATSSRT